MVDLLRINRKLQEIAPCHFCTLMCESRGTIFVGDEDTWSIWLTFSHQHNFFCHRPQQKKCITSDVCKLSVHRGSMLFAIEKALHAFVVHQLLTDILQVLVLHANRKAGSLVQQTVSVWRLKAGTLNKLIYCKMKKKHLLVRNFQEIILILSFENLQIKPLASHTRTRNQHILLDQVQRLLELWQSVNKKKILVNPSFVKDVNLCKFTFSQYTVHCCQYPSLYVYSFLIPS